MSHVGRQPAVGAVLPSPTAARGPIDTRDDGTLHQPKPDERDGGRDCGVALAGEVQGDGAV